MKKKTVQYFTQEYLEQCKAFTPEQVLDFLDNYQKLVNQIPEKCQAISLKIEPSLLGAFKQKAKIEGVPYQTKVKQLMREWLTSSQRK